MVWWRGRPGRHSETLPSLATNQLFPLLSETVAVLQSKGPIVLDEFQGRESREVGADRDVGAHRVLEAKPGDNFLRALLQDEVHEALRSLGIGSPLHNRDAANLSSCIGRNHVFERLAVIFRFRAVVQPGHAHNGLSSDDQGDRAGPRRSQNAYTGLEPFEPLEAFVLTALPKDLRGEKDVPSPHSRGIPRRDLSGIRGMEAIVPRLRVWPATGFDLLFLAAPVDDDDQRACIESRPEHSGPDIFGWDLAAHFLGGVIGKEKAIPGQRLVDFHRPPPQEIRSGG